MGSRDWQKRRVWIGKPITPREHPARRDDDRSDREKQKRPTARRDEPTTRDAHNGMAWRMGKTTRRSLASTRDAHSGDIYDKTEITPSSDER